MELYILPKATICSHCVFSLLLNSVSGYIYLNKQKTYQSTISFLTCIVSRRTRGHGQMDSSLTMERDHLEP